MAWELTCYWFDNAVRAVDFADSWFAKIADIFLLMSALLLAHKKAWHAQWKSWEEPVMRMGMYVFFVLFFVNAIFIIPFNKSKQMSESESALKNISDTLLKEKAILADSNDQKQNTINALEARNQGADLDAWPALTDNQISEWVATLTPYKIKSIRVIWWPETHAKLLFKSFQQIGIKIGCKITSYANPSQMPCMEVVGNGNDPSVEALRLLMDKDLNVPVGSISSVQS